MSEENSNAIAIKFLHLMSMMLYIIKNNYDIIKTLQAIHTMHIGFLGDWNIVGIVQSKHGCMG